MISTAHETPDHPGPHESRPNTTEDTMTSQQPLTDEQLNTIEARATHERLTPGPWRLDRESCDCGGDYPCGHGMYVTGIVTPTPTWFAAERAKRTGEKPRDYDFHRSEVSDFTDADWELMAAARDDVPALVAEIHRLRAQRRYLIDQLAKKDAASGEADQKLREFLAADPDGGEMAERLTGTRPCGHDDYHDPHKWADRPGVWCPGRGYGTATVSSG